MRTKIVGVLLSVCFVLGVPINVRAQAHEFPSSDIVIAQALANEIVCRDSALGRVPPHGSDASFVLERPSPRGWCDATTGQGGMALRS
jgi:hypothetical protein